MGVYEDATDFGVGFAPRVGGVEGVLILLVSLLSIGVGLSLIRDKEREMRFDYCLHMSLGHLSLTGTSS